MTDERTEEQAPSAAPAVEDGDATASPPPPAEPTPAPAPSAPPAGAARPVATATETMARPSYSPAAAPDENGSMSMAYDESFKPLKEGSVVTGTVVHIDREGVLVDVGTKS